MVNGCSEAGHTFRPTRPASLTSPRSIATTLALGALACGVFFRLWGLDVKLYTNDEATTSVHVSGHTIADYLTAAAQGRIDSAAAALNYQGVDSATSATDVVRSLAVEDPQHPPLFYLIERGWETMAGTSIAARRALPAIFGILAITAAFAFGATLVDRTFGLLLAALVAISPFHILYAQQAREYSLWTCFVFAGSAALLRGLSGGAAAWPCFCLLTIGGLYTDVLYLYTLGAQALFVVFSYRTQARRSLAPFAICAAVAVAAFLPWMATLAAAGKTVTNNAYLSAPIPLAAFALKWVFNAGAVFFDFDYVRHVAAVAVPFIGAFVVFGFAAMRKERPSSALYVALLGLVTATAFVTGDLIAHTSRSTAARYLIPTWAGLEASAAFGIWTLLHGVTVMRKRCGAAALAALIAAGTASAAVASSRLSWWGDASVAPIGPMARIVKGYERRGVTVVFRDDQRSWNFAPMELANEIPPGTRFELLSGSAAPIIPRHGVTMLLDPSLALRDTLRRRGASLQVLYAQPSVYDDLGVLRRQTRLTRAHAGFADDRATLWLVTPRRGLS